MVAVQREFANGSAEFPTGDKFTRIAVYDLHQLDTRAETNALCNGLRCGGDWKFYFYRVDFNDSDNWASLSEVISIGTNEYAVVERDSEVGTASELKKIYAFSLADLEPDSDGIPGGDDNDTVNKVLVLNVLEESFPYEKVESLALTPDNDLWVGLDNDGGEMESRLINTGPFQNPLD